MTLQPRSSEIHSPNLWDLIVRVTHWGLATGVIANALLTHGGSAAHLWFGWFGMIVLVMRLVWGIFGISSARFSSFPPNPMAAIRHLFELARGKPRGYPSHNPAGAMMAYALWACFALMALTGLSMNATKPWIASQQAAILARGNWSQLAGAAGATENDDGKQGHLVKTVHESVANLMLVLALLHVSGVVIEGRRMSRNLITPMLLGARTGKTGR